MLGTDTPDKLAYSIKELSAALAISPPTIYREVKRGRLHITKIGRKSVVLADEARRYIAALEDRAA